ncbi:hypothetical protein SD70_00745 [Gordoniibacillus kamchatkensis]|uniref:Uncharacterized protein n=1 Tax=Gordoniibacillus kamchatkensis TaxID=1590651 RepID=A0ABR5AN72_9BACL|nr:hypothetical protein SD70_00745 [Paenibacillus sp. VKM B-2647]
MLAVQLFFWGFVCWLGLYMIYREARNLRVLLSGLCMLACAAGMAADLLFGYCYDLPSGGNLLRLQDYAYYLSLAGWYGALLSGSAESGSPRRVSWRVLWSFGLPLVTILSGLGWMLTQDPDKYAAAFHAVVLISLLFIAAGSIREVRFHQAGIGIPGCFILFMPLIVYTGFVTASFAWPFGSLHRLQFFLYGLSLIPSAIRLMIGEIRKQGESWLPDFFRSLDYSLFFTLLFSGQVAVAIIWGGELNFRTLLLLMASVAISIAFQVYSYPIRSLLDNIAFATFPNLLNRRAELRIVEIAQVRIDEETAPEQISDEELFQYIRRALSHLGNLQKLASNPLTRLTVIERRLKERGAPDGVLERAVELKNLLTETILQMKPNPDKLFDTADDWRFFNALYFPYVIGIKPYSIRYADERLDAHAKHALDWFRTCVPERTCYNWQNAGARLISLHIKEKIAL